MSDELTHEYIYEVVGVRQLTEEQAEQARALRELCHRTDGLDLKLSINAGFKTPSAEPYAFLCTVDETLVGFCTLEGDDNPDLELCGMVHPAYRRRSIGRALLHVALDSARRRLATLRVLVICEEASVSGRAFIAASGGQLRFSEHRMEVTTPPAPPATPKRLDVRQAGAADAPALARIIGGAFGQSDSRPDEIVRDLAMGERYFLAWLDEVPVGAFKVFNDSPKAYIYAFGVLPEYRRHGYAREILNDILPRLFAEGWTAVGLEVDADNAPARALYRAVGFHDVTTYGYYEQPMTPVW
ncbi:MAG TPA: GNAT family N-acetyltransferase [Ktedonobacterales bacterium]